jgi:hypothetical protein
MRKQQAAACARAAATEILALYVKATGNKTKPVDGKEASEFSEYPLDLIREVVVAKTEAATATGVRIGSLRYFAKAISERAATWVPVESAPTGESTADVDDRVGKFRSLFDGRRLPKGKPIADVLFEVAGLARFQCGLDRETAIREMMLEVPMIFGQPHGDIASAVAAVYAEERR